MTTLYFVGGVVALIGMSVGFLTENIYMLLLNGFLYIGTILLGSNGRR